MNLLFLSLLYHERALAEATKNARDGLQNQINNYQWAMIDGLKHNMNSEEKLDIVNALPVGVFPTHYRKLSLPDRNWSESFRELGSLNLPWVKQWQRQRKATVAIRSWAMADPNNRHILLYSLYLPYMKAIAKVKRQMRDLKATVIVTDLPNELGIASGRRGLLQRIEYAMGNRKTELCREFDGFVLLTEHMAEALPVEGKAQMVIEGLVLAQGVEDSSQEEQEKPLPVVLYTGTLNRELGIKELLEAFEERTDCALWLCGKGDMEKEIERACKEHSHIQYFGFVSQAKALSLQSQADILINPRRGEGLFTRYSFPSKTLEYMRSGKPVLCYPLEGIPSDYEPYLCYISQEGAKEIGEAVSALLALPREERLKIGENAKNFALSQKNAVMQSHRLLAFLRKL